MKRVTLYAIGGTALFYTSLGCMGYAAFGADVPGNYLTGFYKPLWLVDIANLAVIIHLIVGYQVFAQTIFAMNEKSLATRWQAHGSFFNKIYTVRLQCKQDYSFQFTPSRLLLRTANIKRGDSTWIMFQVLSLLCLVVSLVSVIGSVAGMLEHLKHAQLFHINL
uniref:Amino acid transporter transmembrane domain-containing protein n=1 Tax=Populus trichocarpa TaxID=3694 RepID=A0A3N7FW90_POPTR